MTTAGIAPRLVVVFGLTASVTMASIAARGDANSCELEEDRSLPGGRSVSASCFPSIPNGARLDEQGVVWLGSRRIQPASDCSGAHVPGTTGWVNGAIQTASNFFTGMTVTMGVPTSPTSSNSQSDVFLWPGISGPTGWLMQPVLEFNRSNHHHWQMQNWFVHLSQGISSGPAIDVNEGDTINTLIEIDYNNPGASCSSDGSHCNYIVAWQDGSGPWNANEFNFPESPKYAEDGILELDGNFYGCNDLPAGSTTGGQIFDAINFYEINTQKTGLQWLFWPDPYNPWVNDPYFPFALPTLNSSGASFNCNFGTTVLHSIFGVPTNGLEIVWNSTIAPQGF